MKSLLSIIFVIFFMICTTLFSQSYLPLEKDNQWYFEYGSCSGSPVTGDCTESNVVSNITADSIMSDGNVYYKVNGINIGFYEWFRSDSTWIYAYNEQENTEVPIFNLKSEINEEFRYGDSQDQITVLKNRDSTVLFDETVEVMEFHLFTGLDISNEFIFSSKFGFIKYDNIGLGGWSYRNLIGCLIDDTSYGVTTSVNEYSNYLPNQVELHQNFPNPFNPVTTITFGIPKSESVKIKVYDILGNELSTLVDNYFPAGVHKVEFNGTNLSSGTYIYRIETNNKTISKKLILLK